MDRLIVGITGASGTPLACRFVNQLKEFTECEVHVVASDSARLTAQYEAPDTFKKCSLVQMWFMIMPVSANQLQAAPSKLKVWLLSPAA